MKTCIILILIIFISSLNQIISSAKADNKKVLTFTTGEYPPYTSQNLKHLGLNLHIIEEAFKLVGYKTKFVFMPWKRAYFEGMKSDTYVGSAFWFPSEEREKFYYYSDAINNEEYMFFHLKTFDMENWKKLSNLRGIRIGVSAGYTYTKEFWDLAKQKVLTVDEAKDDRQNFTKLFLKRIQIFPIDKLVGYNILKKHFKPTDTKKITYHPKPLVKASAHLLISRKRPGNEKLLRAFNRGLAMLKKSGRHKKMKEAALKDEYNLK